MQGIQTFYLYGEAPRDVDERFVHLEDLAERSRPADWNIRPHAHANLNHVFLITHGAGELLAEGASSPFKAPCLLLIPAGAVHAFVFEPESQGAVLTVAEEFLRDLILREAAFAEAFAAASAVELDAEASETASAAMAVLGRELSWTALARTAAVEAQLATILVAAVRRMAHAPSGRSAPGPRAVLVARFRALIEQRFRRPDRLEAYCDALGVTPSRLRAACLALAGQPPARLIQDRLVLEAKRSLIYSNMTVAEIAYDLGFDDPAYFSRVFSGRAGVSPRRFRARRLGAGAA